MASKELEEELLSATARCVTSTAALEDLLREWQPDKEGSRRSGRDTAHAIIGTAQRARGNGGFALYLGGCDAQLPAGCTHVLTLWDEGTEPPALNLTAESEAPHRTIIRVRDTHDADIRQHFECCSAILAECAAAGGVAYAHCQMGRSRSASVTIAFLMREYQMPLIAAFARVAERRNVSALNYGFWAQLCDEEQCLAASSFAATAPGGGQKKALPAEVAAPQQAWQPTLPLPQYFRTLGRVSSPLRAMRSLSHASMITEWRRQRSMDAEERRAGPAAGRLVHNLRFVCAELAAGARSTHCATVLRIMDGATFAEAEASAWLWGSNAAAAAAVTGSMPPEAKES
eukprot:COSAG01_NODE_3647_length_5829_cov_27.360558_4_plen_344_part_00